MIFFLEYLEIYSVLLGCFPFCMDIYKTLSGHCFKLHHVQTWNFYGHQSQLDFLVKNKMYKILIFYSLVAKCLQNTNRFRLESVFHNV
jgi:hypothetical protein